MWWTSTSRQILQRQAGDGAPVVLPFQEVSLQFACVRHELVRNKASYPPLFPVLRQPRVQGTVRPLDLLKAEPVEARVGQQRDQFARRGVRRGHRESLAVDPREPAVGFAPLSSFRSGGSPIYRTSAASSWSTDWNTCGTVVGPVMIAEAANDRIGLLNLDADRESAVAEQPRQRVEVLPDRGSTRTHQELRRRQSFELTADEVKAFRVTDDPCFLIAQAKPPCCEELSQLGEDDPFELPSRTGQDHEVIGVANQPQVAEVRILAECRVGPCSLVVDDQSQGPPASVGIRPVNLRWFDAVGLAGLAAALADCSRRSPA